MHGHGVCWLLSVSAHMLLCIDNHGSGADYARCTPAYMLLCRLAHLALPQTVPLLLFL